MNPVLSVLHATARLKPSEPFPNAWRGAMLDWHKKADHPERIEYVLSVHESRWDQLWEEEYPVGNPPIPAILSLWGSAKCVRNAGLDSNISNVNFAASQTTAPIMVGTMDDLYPPEHWDTLLIEAIPNVEEPWVIHAATTRAQDLEVINAGAITRKYYEEVLGGTICHPSYDGMFAEYEFTMIAYGTQRVLQRFDILFRHDHWATETRGRDAIDNLHSRAEAYREGLANLKARAAQGFPRS